MGVPIGMDKFVTAMMDKKLNELEVEVNRASRVLRENRHSLCTVLRSKTIYKLDYSLGLVHPTLMLELANRMNCLLEKMLGIEI